MNQNLFFFVNDSKHTPEKAVRDRNLRQTHATPPARDVVDHVTNRFAVCYFLPAVHWNGASIPNRFRDIRQFRPQNMLTNKRTNKRDQFQYLLADVNVMSRQISKPARRQ